MKNININNYSKIISFLLLFTMMFNSVIVFADGLDLQDETDKDLFFDEEISSRNNYEEDGIVYSDSTKSYVLGYKGNSSTIELPASVKRVGDRAFFNKKLEKIILNEGLEEIGKEAFSNNNLNGDLIIPSTVKFIKSKAFADNLISSVDLSLTEDLEIESFAFQDNSIRMVVGLNKLDVIAEGLFMNNLLKDIDLNDNIKSIGKEAFLANLLSEVKVRSKDVEIGKDAFASNGRYVELIGDNINSDKSKINSYGHIVNPVNVIIRSFEVLEDGSLRPLLADKNIRFNPQDADNFFTLNNESYYKPDYIVNYMIDSDSHPDRLVAFTPDKDDYVVAVYYKKIQEPTFVINQEEVKKFLEIKKEGSNIYEEDLLKLVDAYDYLGNNISENMSANPFVSIGIKAGEYQATYSVADAGGRKADFILNLPIDIDPLKIKISNTEWRLEDFIYEGNAVKGLSKKGQKKAEIINGLAVPHINPYTMEAIEVVDFSSESNSLSNLDGVIRSGDLIFGNPDTIKVIERNSFYFSYIGSMPSVRFPDMPKLEYIGDNAFSFTKVLVGLPYMPNIKYIGDWAFSDTGLKSPLMDVKKLEYIGDNAFSGAVITRVDSILPNIKYVGRDSFRNSTSTSSIPEMPVVEHIGDYAFYQSDFSSYFYEMPELKYVGRSAFQNVDIRGPLSNAPNLRYIGNNAFRGTDIDGELPDFKDLEYIGNSALYRLNITGSLPKNMMNLTYIGDNAFGETKIGGEFPYAPNLEYIGHNAFEDIPISGKLPDMLNLKFIGDNAFIRTNISGEFPNIPNVERIGTYAFLGLDITGPLPSMPKLKEIGMFAFDGSNISGPLPYMPMLNNIRNGAFRNTKISGRLPEMPSLKIIGQNAFVNTEITGFAEEYPELEYIGDWTFTHMKPNSYTIIENKFLTGNLPKMPKIEYIHGDAFHKTSISGNLVDMPRLISLGDDVFRDTNIKTDKPIYISNRADISKRSFFVNENNEPQVLLTMDGKDAPNVVESEYHILNPFSIGFVGKDSKDNILLGERQVVAKQDGDNITIDIPEVEGYVDSGSITIKKSELVDGVYTYVYKSIHEFLNENGGNRYQFSHKPTSSKVYYSDSEIINSYLYLSTVGEPVLKDGRIELKYDSKIYRDFFIPESKGVKDISYKDGSISIKLDDNLSQGTEIGLPVSFKFKEGVLPERLFPVNAYLYDGQDIKGYQSVEYGVVYKDPSYKSLFRNGSKTIYENIVVENKDSNYDLVVTLYPRVDSFIRDFNAFSVEYDTIYYKNAAGNKKVAELISPEWKNKKDSYSYDIRDYSGQVSIPPLRLLLKRPDTTDEQIVIRSNVSASVDTSLSEYAYVRLDDTNYLNIHVEERDGDVFSKSISNPHSNNRQSYFYDNKEERNHDFKWSLSYNVHSQTDELTLTDYDLDKRMKYTGVDPNGERARVRLLDKDKKVLSEMFIRNYVEIDKDMQDKVDSIEFKYFNLMKGTNINPFIITKLKDVNKEHFDPENKDNSNRFYNYMRTEAETQGKTSVIGTDYAFTNILKDNLDLATDVNIEANRSDLSYGKTANSVYYLKSNEFFDKNIKELKYTALVDPSHRLEDVVLLNDLLGRYEVSQTRNGYTKIDFVFEDLDVFLEDKNSLFSLFKLKTTPKDKSSNDLKVYGFLNSSDEYDIYQKGDGLLEGLDKSNYSYDESSRGIINGEFFSIKKLIGKGDEVSQTITTQPGEEFFYRFEIDNGSTTKREDFELIDILPFEGDFNNSNYHNKVNVEKLKNIKLPAGFTIEYLNRSDFINADKDSIIQGLSDANWSSDPSENTKAIKIKAKVIEAKGDLVQIDIPMITKSDLEVEDNLKTNTNIFAYNHKNLGYDQALSNPVQQVSRVNVPEKNIKLKKVSVFMGEEDGVMEGVRFYLKDFLGNIVDSKTTDSNGDLTFTNVPVGDYTVEESGIQDGYKNMVSIVVKAEDMKDVSHTLDLGKVKNHRVDEYEYLFKNVEVIDDLNNISYKDLRNTYSRDIAGSSFNIKNISTGDVQEVRPSKFGASIVLRPGVHEIHQTYAAKDNGLQYKLNSIRYKFEIDKFGNVLLGDGRGDSLINKEKQVSNVIYFPNTMDYKTSTVEVTKTGMYGRFLQGAEFTLFNAETGETFVRKTNSDGKLRFTNLKPGLYSLKETKAPNGYALTSQVEFINVPVDESKLFEFSIFNQIIRLNVHKYKVVADKVPTESQAKKIADNLVSSTGGKFIIKDLVDFYQVREVWENNNISIDGRNFKTNSNGSVLEVEETMEINEDAIIQIKNSTKIPNHYEPDIIEEHIADYTSKENFNGTIDIDIEVKPLKGTLYVSKYVLDENDKAGIKEGSFTNGAVYDLMVNKGKGFEKMDSKRINNSNYAVFKDLDPNYEYKVIEASVPEGQEESEVKEIDVNFNKDNNYTVTTIFRNKIPRRAGEIAIKKIDGDTNVPLEGVEFKLMDRNGISKTATTKEDGSLVFEDVEYSEAPYKLIETKTKDGYRLPKETITITEDDIESDDVIIVKNYKMTETPDTGTLGRLPFIGLGFGLIIVAFVFKRKELI